MLVCVVLDKQPSGHGLELMSNALGTRVLWMHGCLWLMVHIGMDETSFSEEMLDNRAWVQNWGVERENRIYPGHAEYSKSCVRNGIQT